MTSSRSTSAPPTACCRWRAGSSPPSRCSWSPRARDRSACAGGLEMVAHHGFADCPPADAFIVTGGPGWKREAANPAMLDVPPRPAAHDERRGVGLHGRHDPRRGGATGWPPRDDQARGDGYRGPAHRDPARSVPGGTRGDRAGRGRRCRGDRRRREPGHRPDAAPARAPRRPGTGGRDRAHHRVHDAPAGPTSPPSRPLAP